MAPIARDRCAAGWRRHGTRKDLVEAIELAADGKVRAHIHKTRLEDINTVFAGLKAGTVDGRMVIDFA